MTHSPTRRSALLTTVSLLGMPGAAASATAAAADPPRDLARRLAAVYPVQPALGYVPALVFSAQRRLDPASALPARSQALLRLWRDAATERPLPADWPQRAGFALFAEAARVERDVVSRDLARSAVLAAIEDTEAGPRLLGLRPWTDDMFMATLLVDRTWPLLTPPEQARTAQALAAALDISCEALQRPDGLFDHAVGSPVAWGRGNGFAALALVGALAGPLRGMTDARVAALRSSCLRHLQALPRLQDVNGLWRQVLDDGQSAPEFTATAMSLAALSAAAAQGWIAPEALAPAAARAWSGIAARVGSDGSLSAVCASTPAGPDTAFYRDRPMVTGLDDRGAAMVMQAALAWA